MLRSYTVIDESLSTPSIPLGGTGYLPVRVLPHFAHLSHNLVLRGVLCMKPFANVPKCITIMGSGVTFLIRGVDLSPFPYQYFHHSTLLEDHQVLTCKIAMHAQKLHEITFLTHLRSPELAQIWWRYGWRCLRHCQSRYTALNSVSSFVQSELTFQPLPRRNMHISGNSRPNYSVVFARHFIVF